MQAVPGKINRTPIPPRKRQKPQKHKLPRLVCARVGDRRHCKPGSVLPYCQRVPGPRTGGVAIFLSPPAKPEAIPPPIHFSSEGSPTIIWVSRSRGLPRSTSSVAGRARLCGTLWLIGTPGVPFAAVDGPGTCPEAGRPPPRVAPGANTPSLAARASLDFPLRRRPNPSGAAATRAPIITGALWRVWWRRWDSNPRGPAGPNGFQVRPVMTSSVLLHGGRLRPDSEPPLERPPLPPGEPPAPPRSGADPVGGPAGFEPATNRL